MNDETRSQDESLPVAALERIDRICLRFEAAWQSGKPPVIEQHFGPAEGAERSRLLYELVLLDLDYRRRGDEILTEEEYRKRFPNDADVIVQAFRRTAARADADDSPGDGGGDGPRLRKH